MTISNYEVFGFKGAIRGMRNPYNSWDKSDSHDEVIGPNDLELCKKLIKAGSDHRKFLRMIHVQVDVKAPFYIWKELDTYKVGTVANSCSTMHTITVKKFGFEDFEQGKRDDVLCDIIVELNNLRKEYLKTKDKETWYSIIRLLPCSYLQLRTLDLNYETLMRMYFARENHKLTEWHTFCIWIETLPYMKEFLEDCK
jgi:hypothetical protein